MSRPASVQRTQSGKGQRSAEPKLHNQRLFKVLNRFSGWNRHIWILDLIQASPCIILTVCVCLNEKKREKKRENHRDNCSCSRVAFSPFISLSLGQIHVEMGDRISKYWSATLPFFFSSTAGGCQNWSYFRKQWFWASEIEAINWQIVQTGKSTDLYHLSFLFSVVGVEEGLRFIYSTETKCRGCDRWPERKQ